MVMMVMVMMMGGVLLLVLPDVGQGIIGCRILELCFLILASFCSFLF